MALNKYRKSADKILIPFAKAFSGLHPNTLSAASVIFALLAGIALIFANESKIEDIFFPGHYIYIMFIIASICIFLNGFLDAVDGQVARLTKKISKRGDFLDHALDRYADILILGGIMLSPFCDPVIGALAIIGVLLTSYMGTQAQALGCGRNYSGLLGRADRLVILIIVPLIQMWVIYYYPSGKIPVIYIESFTILEYTMLWFFLAGNFTAIHRGIQSWRELYEQDVPTRKQRAFDFYTKLSQPRMGEDETLNKKPQPELHKKPTTFIAIDKQTKTTRPQARKPIRTKPKRYKRKEKPKEIPKKEKKKLKPRRVQKPVKVGRSKRVIKLKKRDFEIEWDLPKDKPGKSKVKLKRKMKPKQTIRRK